jgi:type IV pilus assembly protein PilA
MKKTYLQKGFTLIELLVVIAIIGILSSVVLASLSTARNKGSDAKIQGQLTSIRSQAELYTGTGTAFTAAQCATTANTLFDTANGGVGTILSGFILTKTRCASAAGLPSNGAAWAVAAETSTGAWCVDSTGVSRGTVAAGTAYSTNLTSVIGVGATSCL